MIAPMFIQNQAALDSLCSQLEHAHVLMVDTEFASERRYFPRFDLLQVGSHALAAVIDMHADLDLRGLVDLFCDPQRTVVVHGGSQDVALLNRRLSHMPARIFDTQLAASLVGYGASVSFAMLVKRITQVVLPKTESLTDWSRRPLKPAQLEYALDDVRYLVPLYDHLHGRLESLGRTAWSDEEHRRFYDPKKFRSPEPRERWRRCQGWSSLSAPQLAILRELAAWREDQAARTDTPSRVLLPDEVMTQLARRQPRHVKELREVRQLFERTIHECGQDILSAIRRGQEVTQLEELEVALVQHEQAGWPALVSFLSALASLRAQGLEIPLSVLAPEPDVEALVGHLMTHVDATSAPSDPPQTPLLLSGWRGEVLGQCLLKAFRGEMRLGVDPRSGAVSMWHAPSPFPEEPSAC